MSAIPLSHRATAGAWQDNFMAVLPAIQTHAAIRFRRLPPDRREEAIAETIAAACQNYQHLATAGRLHRAYVTSLATFSSRHTAQHRHVGGSEDAKDVLSPLARRRHGFTVHRLDGRHDPHGWKPVISEDKHYSPADVAGFRLDFSTWFNGFDRRHRRIIHTLATGERPTAVAHRFGISSGRLSQLRHRYRRSWWIFQGEAQADLRPVKATCCRDGPDRQ